MNAGKLFMLLTAIGLILLAASKKGQAIVGILKGSGTYSAGNGVSPNDHPDLKSPTIGGGDLAPNSPTKPTDGNTVGGSIIGGGHVMA